MAAPIRSAQARTTRPPIDARHARVAVSVLFVVNSLILGNVVPWLPSIKQELALSNTLFGLGWAAGPLGGMLLGITAGPLSARFGSGRTATTFALVAIATLPALAVAPIWAVFAGSLFAMGAADAITDAAMNAHALRVQRRYGRSIINSFHALWSTGAVAGGLLGATMVGLGVSRPVHLISLAGVLAVAVLLADRWQLAGPEDAELVQTEVDATAVGGTSDVPDGQSERVGPEEAGREAPAGVMQALRTAPWLLLGFALLPTMGGAVEDSAASWAAVLLRETLDATPFVASLGFVAMQSSMVVGRVTGDRLVDRFGAAAVARTGALLAALGMLAVVTGPAASVVIAGFGLAGLGVATLFPLGLAAAGEIPGVRSADGVAIAGWLARLSFLIVPPVVGTLADATSLQFALLLVVACALVAAAASGLLPGRRPRS